MKVAMLGWEFPPFMAGGLGVHCLQLTRHLARSGVEIDFYMPHMENLEGPMQVADHHDHLKIKEVEADPGISPYGSRSQRYKQSFNAAVALYNERLVSAFHSTDADVLHCHDWITLPAALALKRRTGLPLVFTVHSIEQDRCAGFAPQSWIEDLERRGVNEADLVIAVSQYTKDLLVRLYGADPERVVPVHNGVDLDRFRAKRSYQDRNAHQDVLFLSRLSPQKAPLFFLGAARRVLEVRPETKFVVAGKGSMLGECIDYVIDHGMTDNVRFAGFVPEEELAEFYAHHGLYVLPSVSEPFGISILEAMATGMPAIISKTTGVGEALKHALKADYWDTDEMADMIIRLLDSEALRTELGQNGADEALRFTWDKSSAKTLEVYRAAARLRPIVHVVTT